MLDLLNKYSLSDILIFIVIFALAIKEAVTFFDWAKGRIKQAFNREKVENDAKAILEERLVSGHNKMKELEERENNLYEALMKLSDKVDMLIASDKDSIKAYITEKHHHHCYEKKWIDDYTLDCLEKRYKHYVEEGGNSFVAELMSEIRELPHQPPQ